ncbi:DUF6924 domain-containing protein [Streptomyces sp. NPDC059168]|uniref:DUF6924 domain-containing protein n=1 Tax=Streptomyces sp. NPDC059168 TaxID=3346753 RepID=UPI0036B04AEC
MPHPLPQGPDVTCPVIRTDFTDSVGWLRVIEALEAPVAVKDAYDGPGSGPNPENADHADWFTSAIDYVTPVNDVHYEGIAAADVTALAPAAHELGYGHLYLADAQTFASPGLPLLGIDIDPEQERVAAFRIPAHAVSAIETNEELGNMFFAEYREYEWQPGDLVVASRETAVWQAYRDLQ